MRALNYINRFLVAATVLVCIGALALAFIDSSRNAISNSLSEESAELKNGFEMPKSSYAAVAGPPFDLRSSAPALGLPDLHDELMLFGIDGRPDADPQFPTVYLSFKGSNNVVPIRTGERRYIHFDRTTSAEHYSFSNDNLSTNLWILPTLQGEKLAIEVGMCNHDGELISSPERFSKFTLSQAESKATARPWSLGKWKVDGSLMARLRARWFGEDLFLRLHGGTEFSHLAGKHRIDFGENEESYSCFLGLGDNLIWKEERWKEISSEDNSRLYPLLHVKKVDDKLILFDLWNQDGSAKTSLSMMRSHDLWLPPQQKENLRFVGARTWSQFLLETGDRRLMITPNDWLLLTQQGWQKLSSQNEIKDYLNHKLVGELFIVDGLEKRSGKQCLTGHLFNSSRSEVQKFEIPLNQTEKPSLAAVNASTLVSTFAPPSPEQNEISPEDASLTPPPHLIRGIVEELND